MTQLTNSSSTSSTAVILRDNSTQSLESSNSNINSNKISTAATSSPIYVEFDPLDEHGHSDNPLHWSTARKKLILIATIGFCFLISGCSSAFSQGQAQMVSDLDSTDLLGELALGMYIVGYSISPPLLAPLSEELGRNAMYQISYTLYFLLFLPIALARNMATVVVCRFLQGAFASAGTSLVSGTISDVMAAGRAKDTVVALFAFSAVFAMGLLPIPFGWLIVYDARSGWRLIQFIQMGMAGVWAVFLFAVLRETRPHVILLRKAAALARSTHLPYTSKIQKPALGQLLRVSCCRPLEMLVREPIITFFSAWLALAWSFYFAIIGSISHVFGTLYDMNQGQLAAIYTSLVVGVSVSLLFNFCVQDKLYARKLDIRGPEARLYAAMLIGPLLPIGCFIYGWTSYSYLPFVAPCVGLAVISCALFTIYLAATQYVMDAYGPFAASGVASLSIVRNLCAGFWPLFTNTFFDNVGFQLAPTIIGCAAVVFSLTSYVLFFLGARIRSTSRFAQHLACSDDNGDDKDKTPSQPTQSTESV
ncbi:hypothetical protein E3P77_00663 [Wallemia ichthyophaga]|uniref:Major facilitator superfamily (MFS) profile domain-containing protein n=1 Tax=Wallemia ichthyophaga TaxID=245174 RepID=A0A4T0J8H2_WALIC|nr:hypothetical protein E3P98_00616 [Wallemia ichthyophaga]TIB02648.1 hypothetical protein E3P95_00842 [Wallemia ichthyophaga]TIB03642.1 hypothetical protein E3P94_00974 [Wallemia ichthyophaga]TIB15767.1 hypothetical protein E3P90_00762 [Wallemia ichthyophaga]TIB17665.1 hypothetical protein E3P93_00619 [Wallemia ichthyophaga]